MSQWFHLLPLIALAVSSASMREGRAGPAAPAGPVVVVDAGHGGRNHGALSADGRHEKEMTLAVATKLAAYLRAGGARVILTRTADDYLTLRQRSTIANAYRADLFISIHGNSSPLRSARGHETHVLSSDALTIDAPALRSTEGLPRLGLDSETTAVLDAVERTAGVERAARIAVRLQAELSGVRNAKYDRGIKQDSHHVLLGAVMPAVLVEVGFVDHPIEGPELFQKETQEEIARALCKGILASLDSP